MGDRVCYLALDRAARLEGAARFPVVGRLAARAGARFLATGAFRDAAFRATGFRAGVRFFVSAARFFDAAALRATALRAGARFFAATALRATALRAGARLVGLRVGARFFVAGARRAALFSAHWAAESRAMGTRKGEQLT
jgi:hypothetical protein